MQEMALDSTVMSREAVHVLASPSHAGPLGSLCWKSLGISKGCGHVSIIVWAYQHHRDTSIRGWEFASVDLAISIRFRCANYSQI